MSNRLELAVIEPWFGESHAVFVNGLQQHCAARCIRLTLPATKWKWRMRMGAWLQADQLHHLETWPDVFLFSDYVNLPALIGFVPRLADSPKIIYFHENQLTYPVRPGRARDFEFCAINVLSCLAADRIVFCTRQQQESFLDGIPRFLKHDDAIDPAVVLTQIEDNSLVIPVGVSVEPFDRARIARTSRRGMPLRMVWPHRFEHDKNPDDFFTVLFELAAEDLPFEVIVCGRSYRDLPPIMSEAQKRLSAQIAHFGFLQGDEYATALASADVVVSTAYQETQGLAIIEAIRAGCAPLLPNRLSYPEILGEKLACDHLFQNRGELRRKLRWMMRHPDKVRIPAERHLEMDRYRWSRVAPRFDGLFGELAKKG